MTESDLSEAPEQPSGPPQVIRQAMDSIRAELGDTRGRAFDLTRKQVAAALVARGYCAIPGQEAVFVEHAGLVYEFHVPAETDGGWPQRDYMGAHVRGAAAPNPPEIPETSCGAPLPTITRVDVSRAHGFCASIDVTVKSTSREYCDAAGFVNRGECPLRPEGAPDREACESYAVAKAGGLRWRVVSGECEVLPCSVEGNCACGSDGYVNRNPAQAAVAGSGCDVEVCAGEACGRIGL